MSIVLAWTNGEAAHVVSDGLVFSETKIFARDRRKFFETPAGLIVGSAGFLRNVEAIERDFADSRLEFFPAVRALRRRVAAAYADMNGFGLPLGVIVVGNDGAKIRVANIGPSGFIISTPGINDVSYLAAGDAADDALLRRLLSCAHGQPDVAGFLREIVRIFAERIPNRIGGEIFSASLPHPAMCMLKNQGSLIALADNSAFSFSSTTTSLSFWNVSETIFLQDGSSITIPATGSSGSPAFVFTGLTANTTYHFGAYYDIAAGTVHLVMSDVNGGKSPGSQQFVAQTIQGDERFSLFADWLVTTPASGSGSGGGSTGGGGGKGGTF